MRAGILVAVRALLTAIAGVTFVFVLLRVSGDPALQILGDDVSPDVLDAFRARMGLDRSIPVQYALYWADILRGDFGVSFRDGRPVTEIVLARMPDTALLMGSGFALALLIGVPAGILAARRPGSWLDRSLMTGAMIGFAMPNFFLAILLILLFSMSLRWLPSAGSGTVGHLMLPMVTIGSYYSAILARFVRATMIEVSTAPFLDGLRARGVSEQVLLRRHILPHTALPTLTIGGLIVGGLVSGATVVETVYAWPGMGRLLVDSVALRDMPVVQMIILILTATMVVVNLTIDMSFRWLDPRLRASG